jgi:acyl carrier protein
MPRDVVLQLLEGAFELPPESLKLEDKISDQWGSISLIGFMAAVDEEFGIVISPQKILACGTVADVVDLVQSKKS